MTTKIKTEAIKKALESGERIGKAYHYEDVKRNKKRKYAKGLHSIHERINRKGSWKRPAEETKSDHSKEKALIKDIRQGKKKPVGEAANSAYGHLFGIDA